MVDREKALPTGLNVDDDYDDPFDDDADDDSSDVTDRCNQIDRMSSHWFSRLVLLMHFLRAFELHHKPRGHRFRWTQPLDPPLGME